MSDQGKRKEDIKNKYVTFCLSMIAKPDSIRKESIKAFMKEFGKSQRTAETYFAKANRLYKKTNTEVSNVAEKVVFEVKAEALRNGLIGKTERTLHLQARGEEIMDKIKSGKCKESVVRGGKAVQFERDLTPSEINRYYATYVSIQSEIAKREGEYAPIKVAPTDTGGNDKEIPAPVTLNVIYQPRTDKRAIGTPIGGANGAPKEIAIKGKQVS